MDQKLYYWQGHHLRQHRIEHEQMTLKYETVSLYLSWNNSALEKNSTAEPVIKPRPIDQEVTKLALSQATEHCPKPNSYFILCKIFIWEFSLVPVPVQRLRDLKHVIIVRDAGLV